MYCFQICCTPNCSCIPVRRRFCRCRMCMYFGHVEYEVEVRVFGLNTYGSQPRNRRVKLSSLPWKPLPPWATTHETWDLGLQSLQADIYGFWTNTWTWTLLNQPVRTHHCRHAHQARPINSMFATCHTFFFFFFI